MAVATLALLVQALIVQLHWHGPTGTGGHIPAASSKVAISGLDTDHGTSSDACALCLEQAMAGHYTLPPAIAFVDEAAPDLDPIAPRALTGLLLRQTSHAWQSRGPPLPTV